MRVLVLSACLLICGCAGVNYAMQEYSGVAVEEIAMPDDTYRVFDKPAQSKMMVTSSIGAAAAQGFGQGLLLNAIDNTPPKPRFDAAAAAYLEKTGRFNCRIVESYILVKPQFEVKYDCTPPAIMTPPTIAPRGKKR